MRPQLEDTTEVAGYVIKENLHNPLLLRQFRGPKPSDVSPLDTSSSWTVHVFHERYSSYYYSLHRSNGTSCYNVCGKPDINWEKQLWVDASTDYTKLGAMLALLGWLSKPLKYHQSQNRNMVQIREETRFSKRSVTPCYWDIQENRSLQPRKTEIPVEQSQKGLMSLA